MIRSRRTAGHIGPSAGAIRRQETGLILLNLAVLSGIALVHALFAPAFGTPPRIFFWALFGRMAMQTGELVGLQALRGPAGRRYLPVYANLSIWLNLGFAFLLSHLAGFQDSHYVVLMVIPVIAAAFRYRPLAIVVVVAAAGALTILEVALYMHAHGGGGAAEYFEAASVSLIYAVVAAVVRSLAREVRAEHRALSSSMRMLRATRGRLLEEERLATVGRMASSIAHEIRNPIALIASSLTLARRTESRDERQELDDIVEQAVQSLERLTSDFLSFARQQPPRLEIAPLTTTLGYVAELARPRAEEHSILIRVMDEQGIDQAEFDPHQIHQALLNLVLNAVDAAPVGSTVVLRSRKERDSDLSLSVENAGEPIQPDSLRQLFEPFFTTKAHGTGLGLAIARRIARAHGGDVVLECNEPQAIRFAIYLPGCLRFALEGGAVGTHTHR